MKFTLNTKPLQSAVNLCVINANVNQYYERSLLVQISATSDTLTINHAADSVLSEVSVKGTGDELSSSIIVDSMMFKNLVSTLTSARTEIEFNENAIIIHNGSGRFSIPATDNTSGLSLPTPVSSNESDYDYDEPVLKSDWKYIKDHQLYAVSNSPNLDIYHYIWLGSGGEVITGDINSGIFTKSMCSQFHEDCMVRDTIINLFNNIPTDSHIAKLNDAYIVYANADSYSYKAEFTPYFESDSFGYYNATMIMSMMDVGESNELTISANDVVTVLKQSSVLSVEKEPVVVFSVEDNKITIQDSKVDSIISATGESESYTLTFYPSYLKSVISSCPESAVRISPVRNADSDEIIGIIVKSGSMVTALAGVVSGVE